MRSYNPASLVPNDPKSLSWAMAWVRRFAGDVPAEDGSWPTASLEDEEWAGWLQATATTVNNVIYYRPHEAAARNIASNPYWSQRISLMGLFQEFRNAEEVAAAIRQSGNWIDHLIALDSGIAPVQGVQLWPGF